MEMNNLMDLGGGVGWVGTLLLARWQAGSPKSSPSPTWV